MIRRMLQRRYTLANWATGNYGLYDGEIGLLLGSDGRAAKFKVGDGTTAWTDLPFFDPAPFAVAGGTVDAITATFAPVPTLVDGDEVRVRAAGANTVTAPTFNANGQGALTVFKFGGQALAAGDIYGAGHEIILRYRESPNRWELLNPAAAGGGASVIDSIADGDTTNAPSRNAVFDALALKVDQSQIDTDNTLAADSDTRVASQKAVKAYIANALTGLLDLKGDTDASANPNYPAASKGDAYYVTVAGKIGGGSGKSVEVGDVYVAKADNAGGTEAAVGTSWFVLEHNLLGALLAANNLSDLTSAPTARTNLGATTLGSGLFTATNPSAITWLRVNADNSVSTRTAAQTRNDLGLALSEIAVNQTAHGFAVGTPVTLNGASWVAADRDDATRVADLIVSEVVDANNFRGILSGQLTLTTGEWDARTGDSGGLTQDEYYWLSSTAGGLTKTQPATGIAQLVLYAISTTVALVRIGEAMDTSGTMDPELLALASVTSAADTGFYFTGAGSGGTYSLTAGGRALGGVAGSADTFPYFSAPNTVTLASITSDARSLLGDADVPRLGTVNTWGFTQTMAALIVDAGTVRIDRSGDAAAGQIVIDVDSGQLAITNVRHGTTTRWQWGMDASGTYFITAYDSGGVSHGTALTIPNAAARVIDATKALTSPVVGTKRSIAAAVSIALPAGYSMVVAGPYEIGSGGSIDIESGAALALI